MGQSKNQTVTGMSDETKKSSSETPSPAAEETKESPAAITPEAQGRDAVSKAHAAGRPSSVVGIFALLIAVAAVSVAGVNFLLWQRQSPLIAALAENSTEQAKQISDLQQSLNDTSRSLADEVRQRREDHATFNTAVQEISAKLGRTTTSWRLAEAEHLLAIANDRLALGRDRHTALIALQNADSKLQVIGDPGLLAVRKLISAEVIALNAVNEPDIAGISLALSNLTETVGKLPLLDKAPQAVAGEKTSEAEGSRSWQDILHVVWEDLKSLVRVRRHDQPIEPLLAPEEEWYLRQNLLLKLEQAQLALLHRDTALFRQSLGDGGKWLSEFFDPTAPGVISLAKFLNDLNKVELSPALPDITKSLRELRSQMRRLDEQMTGVSRKGGDL